MLSTFSDLFSSVVNLPAALPLRDELGQGMAEYALILALVAIVVVGALIAIGGGIGSTLNTVTASF